MTPLVSVIMSVHNEPKEFLDTSVLSICNQKYKNIEFIIIDDASDQEIKDHLIYLESLYPQIHLVFNKKNKGLTASLNIGLKLAKGKYIARMDADDYSLPQRIAKQVNFLETHPDIDIVGTGVVSFGHKITFMSQINGATNDKIQSDLFFTSSLCHPSVMIRKDFLMTNELCYDESIKKGQDFDLWERSSIYGKLQVLKDILLLYRLHERQITSTNQQEQINTATMVIKRRLKRLGLIPSHQEYECHLALGERNVKVSIEDIKKWMEKLEESLYKGKNINAKKFSNELRRRLVLIKLKRSVIPSLNEIGMALSIVKERIIMRYRLKKIKEAINNIPNEKQTC